MVSSKSTKVKCVYSVSVKQVFTCLIWTFIAYFDIILTPSKPEIEL